MHILGVIIMFKSCLLTFSILVSATSFAEVSFNQKQMRVASLLNLENKTSVFTVAAYQRELNYEAQGLSVDERAKNETNLLANKIRVQVNSAYREALAQKQNSDDARAEIEATIQKDLELASPELKEELLTLAINTLNSIDAGAASEEVHLTQVEAVMKKEVIKRKVFLNAENIEIQNVDKLKDPNKKEYDTTAELMESLVSDNESIRWVSSSNQTIRSAKIKKTQSQISLQIKVEFLGAELEAGPTITFKRDLSTSATINAEGLSPILKDKGNTFDYSKYDRLGKPLLLNGQEVKRFISFSCDADLTFESEYQGSGGFKFMGVGGDITTSQRFTNSVTLTSRRLALPYFVAGKSMTMKYISELCHNNFLSAKFNNAMTVSQSLNIMMKNIVAGLVFSHPKTKCVVDTQCKKWFKTDVISLVKLNKFPRCTEDRGPEKFRSCKLRGLEGQNCPVYERGIHTSNGQNEYTCDTGLKCVTTKSRTLLLGAVWSFAKGSCKVTDKKNYISPL
jgi:hypothetical protein